MKHLGVILVVIVVVAGCAATAVTSEYAANVLSYAVVLAIFAVAIGLTLGQLGYFSFGHAAFFGVGAYTVGVLVAFTGLNYWLLVPVSLVPGLLLGGLVGLASARLGGAYFAIATLTLAEMLRLIALNWVDVTRGPLGLMVMVPPIEWMASLGWSPAQSYLFVLMLVLGATLVLLTRLSMAPIGRMWTFIREAPSLAESIGIPTARARVINIALSGAIASMAGGLLIPKVMVLSPDLFGVGYSGAGLLAVMLGGKASLIGAAVGGLVFGGLPEVLRAIDEYRLALFAILLLLVVRLRPEGLVSLLPKRKRRAVSQEALVEEMEPTGVVKHLRRPAVVRSGPVLEASNVDKRFIGLVAVDNVSLQLEHGELVGIIGPNGAGKTTLLSMLSGFLVPTSGEVMLNSERITGMPPHRIAACGLVRTFQQTAHCSSLSVYDNVFFASYLRHREAPWSGVIHTAAYRQREKDRRAHALACLKEVGLEGRASVVAGSLSYGEQKLLGVAIALAAEPAVLLLDEPAAGLNHTEGNRLAEVLRRLKAKGCTIAIIDHNLALIMSICDRIVVLHHGHKIAEDKPKIIAEHPQVVRAYLGSSVEETAA